MLNTLPPSASPVLPATPIFRRRRGGQPSNRNALNHGLYSVKNPTPLTAVSHSTAAYRQLLDEDPDVFSKTIMELRVKVDQIYQLFEKAGNNRSKLACFNLLVRTIGIIPRLGVAWFLQRQPVLDLQSVSKNALAFILYDFRDHGITCDADSFREKKEKSDFNSLPFRGSLYASLAGPHDPFITPRQWHVLEPLLPPSDHTARRGRPPADPRELLDAIFWKFTHHARWQDLPAGYPPMLTCRRYYRRLFLSGRLATLYSALYKDLRERGRISLTTAVKRGYVTILENKVILRPGLDEIWEMRTALLFIQQGLQVLRRIRREKVLERRRKFPSIKKMLMMGPVQNSPLIKEEEFSYTPIDLSNLGLRHNK